ncbi:MAG: hypothetical protein WKG07_10285 [Hymenobacter sp.]
MALATADNAGAQQLLAQARQYQTLHHRGLRGGRRPAGGRPAAIL